jgi:type II secretory pathway component PulF
MQAIQHIGRKMPNISDSEKIIIASNCIVAFGLAALMVIRWFAGPAPEVRKSIFRACARVLAWVLVFLGLTVVPVATPKLAVIDLLFYGLGIVWIVSLAAIIAMAYGKQAASQQYAMLALVGAAVERAMPLVEVFAAFGQERGGWMQRRTRKIAQLLMEGVPLTEAVEKVPGVLPPEAVPLVRVGYETGTLPFAIRHAIAVRNFFEPVWQSVVPKILYICVFPVMAASLMIVMGMKVFPNYSKIFKDFGMKLPAITSWVITSLNFPNLPSLALVAFWLAATCLAAYVVLRYAGSIRWNLPGTGWLAQRRNTATVLDGLALAAETQKPMADAIKQMAIGHPQRKIANALWRAYGEMHSGENDLDVLLRAGLLSRSDLAMLATAQRAGNFVWAARELADSHRRRLIYRTYAAVQAIFPPVIVGYAVVVFLICAAMFLPLIDLIHNLSSAL